MKRVLLVSAGIHAALIASIAAVRVVPARTAPGRANVEFDLVAAPSVLPPETRAEIPRAGQTPPPDPPQTATRAYEPPSPTSARRAAYVPAARAARSVQPSVGIIEPPTPSGPVMTGTNADAEPAPTAAAQGTTPRVNVMSLFTGARSAAVASEREIAGPPHGSTADREARARAATQDYVNEVLATANQMEPSQVHAYYGALSRRMRETWRPGFYRTPSMVDALLAAPRNMANVAARYRDRASTFASTGRPDDPARPLIPTDFQDRSTYSTVTTSSIVEVEQDETGRVLSVRVVRSARVHDFDEAAIAAVRAAFPQQDAVRLPGGRRSRWAFDVVVSRDVILPVAGFTFNESNGFFEMHYPGAMHVRTRVRPTGSRLLAVPWPLPQTDVVAQPRD